MALSAQSLVDALTWRNTPPPAAIDVPQESPTVQRTGGIGPSLAVCDGQRTASPLKVL